MAEQGEETAVVRDKPALGWRIAKWIGIAIVSLLLLAVLAVFALNTAPGRRFVVSQLDGYELASGLKINVGRLDGSLYGKLVIRELRLSDPKGVFASSPRIELDWRPFAFVDNHAAPRTAHNSQLPLGR